MSRSLMNRKRILESDLCGPTCHFMYSLLFFFSSFSVLFDRLLLIIWFLWCFSRFFFLTFSFSLKYVLLFKSAPILIDVLRSSAASLYVMLHFANIYITNGLIFLLRRSTMCRYLSFSFYKFHCSFLNFLVILVLAPIALLYLCYYLLILYEVDLYLFSYFSYSFEFWHSELMIHIACSKGSLIPG